MLHDLIIIALIFIIAVVAFLWYMETKGKKNKHNRAIQALMFDLDAETDEHFKHLMDSKDPYESCKILLQDIHTLTEEKSLLEFKVKEFEKEHAKVADGLDKKSHEIIHISHQMRTSLSGLLGFTHFLEATDLTAEQSEFVTIISTSSNELLTLVNSVIGMTPHTRNDNKTETKTHSRSKIPYVLVVDDNHINKKLLAKVLERENLKVIYASNGLEAVALRKEKNLDIIFMDIQMPVMNGVDATKAIRKFENEENKNIVPIVALTGNTDKEARDTYLNAGMTDYMSKPIMIEEVRKRIQEIR